MDAYATDAEIPHYGLRVLKDDRGHFPKYEAAYVWRADRTHHNLSLVEDGHARACPFPPNDHFTERFAKEQGLAAVPGIAPDALAMLQAYDWPGNVRELENVLERAVIISRGSQLRLELPQVQHVPQRPATVTPVPTDGLLTEHQRRERDRAAIRQALQRSGGKVFGPGGAAEILGVKPTTLASRIKRWGIDRPELKG